MTEPEPVSLGTQPATGDDERAPLEHPVLHATRPLAALAIVALVTGRALAPALRGVGVGMSAVVYVVERTGAMSTQIFAFVAMMTAILAIMAAARSRLPMAVRLAALTLGGFAILPTVWALHEPVPELSASLVAASASLLALAAVPVALRSPVTRSPGLVVGFTALGGLLRVVAIGGVIAIRARTAPGGVALTSASLGRVFSALGTAALLCDAAAIGIALVWIASRSRGRAGAASLVSPAAAAALVIAALVTREALAGQAPEAQGVDLVCWRAAVRMMAVPDAALPLGLRVFVAFLAPLVGLAALTVRNTLAPLAGAVALALAARGALEMPPCALMLVVASLAAALTATDRNAMWTAVTMGAASQGPTRG